MERRDFIKALLSCSLLGPEIISSRPNDPGKDIFLISDSPHEILPGILKALRRGSPVQRSSFSLEALHPNFWLLKKSFEEAGWLFSQALSEADIRISFKKLRQACRPSFTFIKSGQVVDVRSRVLLSLWREMQASHPASDSLTVVSFATKTPQLASTRALIYINGKKAASLPLEHNLKRSYASPLGKVEVSIEERRAWISRSSCSQSICLSSLPVHIAGEKIICAPNHFLLILEGSKLVDTVIG